MRTQYDPTIPATKLEALRDKRDRYARKAEELVRETLAMIDAAVRPEGTAFGDPTDPDLLWSKEKTDDVRRREILIEEHIREEAALNAQIFGTQIEAARNEQDLAEAFQRLTVVQQECDERISHISFLHEQALEAADACTSQSIRARADQRRREAEAAALGSRHDELQRQRLNLERELEAATTERRDSLLARLFGSGNRQAARLRRDLKAVSRELAKLRRGNSQAASALKEQLENIANEERRELFEAELKRNVLQLSARRYDTGPFDDMLSDLEAVGEQLRERLEACNNDL